MKNLSIKKKLYFMILAIFIPMIINQVFQIHRAFDKRVDAELKSNEDFAEAVSVSFSNYIERIWDTELAMGLAITEKNFENSEEIGNYMRTIKESQPTIKGYRWIDPETLKITASSSPEAVGVELAGREYINEILRGASKTVSDMVISRVNHEYTVVVARGLRKDGVLKGIVAATIDVDKIGLVMPSSRSSGYSFFGLVDKKGDFVYRNGVSDVAAKKVSVKDDPNFIPAFAGETVISKRYLSAINGEAMMGVNLPMQNIGWVAFANTSYNQVLARTYSDMARDFLILLVIIVIGIAITLIIGTEIVQPINILQSSAIKMSNGNLNVRTEIVGTDEIALAAQAFDKMAESIEQYDMLKTQFFSNISHELKTPLNIILSSIQMIGSSHLANQNCEVYVYTNRYMSMMKKNCYRLLRLINNLIDITRLDSGFLKFNIANYNIVSVVEDITLSIVDFSESKGIKVIFDTDMEEKIIACDPDKIERIMLNLLSNSIKFTPSGGSIYVNIFDKEDKIVIKVADTGIGIPEDKLNIIFERFRQVDSSLQREYEGSGIGLSIVKALVEGHGGNINVSSKSGEGTEVIIELPALKVPEEESSIKNSFEKRDIDKVQKINIEFSDIYN